MSMRRFLVVAVLGSVLLAGVGAWTEPSVCTDPCGQDEKGGCEVPGCDACVSLAVVPVAPEAPVLIDAPVDLGAVDAVPATLPADPPASEIRHVPRAVLV